MSDDEVPVPELAGALDVLDWRRRTAELYARVRAEPEPAAAHAVWAAGREEMLLRHPATPVLPEHRTASAVPVAPYDGAWRFEGAVEDADPQRLEVRTGTDGVVVLDRVGRVRLGDVGTLDVWWHGGYGGGLFVPVADRGPTPDGAGYGGGRYVLDTAKGADLGSRSGPLVVDLNLAYLPSCAYDPAWACPLAPPGNRLDAHVPAGELYAGPWAHAV